MPCFSQHVGGTLMQSSMCLDPALGEIRLRNSFYGHPFFSAVSIRAAISFLRKCGHSILINFLGSLPEQCRYVNPFVPTVPV